MKIVQLAPWEETVPPVKYGGTELVVSNITEGLVERGHEVYLFAAGNSKTSAHLIPIMNKTLRDEYPTDKYSSKEVDAYRSYWKFVKIAEILKKIEEIGPDIVHNHLSWRLMAFSHFIKQPMITTVHGPASSVPEQETFKKNKDQNYISISNNQRKALPELHWIDTIYNGIDVDKFTLGKGEGKYFVFLGRTTPEKGLAEICKMIRQTNHKLKIAAKVDAVDIEYFNKEIKPYIDGKQIEFLGEIDHQGKNNLLKDAAGLLLWLNWEEPFGLVVTEAMACGTPVIVNPRGSMKELIVDNQTGFLVNSLDEMKQKLDSIHTLDRNVCRNHVITHFSKQKMVSDYERVMQALIK